MIGTAQEQDCELSGVGTFGVYLSWSCTARKVNLDRSSEISLIVKSPDRSIRIYVVEPKMQSHVNAAALASLFAVLAVDH